MYYENPKILYRGKRVDLLSVEADHPRGGKITREVVDHPGAVVILPLLDEKTVLLIRNERYVVNQTLWELPAGTLEKGEQPQTCAFRELIEETGYQAEKLSLMMQFFSTPGFCNELLYVFLAQELSYRGQDLDETEKIDVEPITLKEALNMIENGVICDAKTICSLLYFNTYHRTLI